MWLNVWELSVLTRLYDALSCPLFDRLFVWISVPGNNGMIFIVLALILLCFKRTRSTGAVMATALVLDVILVNLMIKPLVARVRPYNVNTAIELLTKAPQDYSFPSGHTAAAFAAATAAAAGPSILHRSLLVYAGLMALSRMYLMVHYPLDVLGGAVCGVLCGLAAIAMWKRIAKMKGEQQ